MVNVHTEEIKKYINDEVEVEYMFGDHAKFIKGKLKSICFKHLSVVVMTKEEKILIKHITSVKRKRTHGTDKADS